MYALRIIGERAWRIGLAFPLVLAAMDTRAEDGDDLCGHGHFSFLSYRQTVGLAAF